MVTFANGKVETLQIATTINNFMKTKGLKFKYRYNKYLSQTV